jgi:hypothetical protein
MQLGVAVKPQEEAAAAAAAAAFLSALCSSGAMTLERPTPEEREKLLGVNFSNVSVTCSSTTPTWS